MKRALAIALIEDVAAAKHGLLTEEQALRENVTDHMMWHHTQPGGRWRRVAPHVFEVLQALHLPRLSAFGR